MESAPSLLGHVEHELLGVVHRGLDVLGHRITDVGDLASHADQLAQQGVLLDDPGVVLGVGDRRGVGLQRDEDRRVPDLLEEPDRRSSSVTVTASIGSPRSIRDRMAPKMWPCAGL